MRSLCQGCGEPPCKEDNEERDEKRFNAECPDCRASHQKNKCDEISLQATHVGLAIVVDGMFTTQNMLSLYAYDGFISGKDTMCMGNQPYARKHC